VDWTVLGGGVAFLFVALTLVACSLAYRQAPHRVESRLSRRAERPSTVAGAAATWGMPAPAVIGIRLALEPGGGRSSVPVRSAIIGATLAVFVVVGTVTFGASLNNLVSHPALYGWNWDYEVTASSGTSMPGAQATRLLDHDRFVASWSPIYFGEAEVDGQPVAALIQPAHASVAPPILSGHAVDGPGQVVAGTGTLAQLHKHVGDLVKLQLSQLGRPVEARVVGTATMPTIGTAGNPHPEMGTGLLVDDALLPAHFYQPGPGGAPPGPNAVLVRLQNRSVAAERSLEAIAAATSTAQDAGVTVVPVLRPAEIVNYRSMGDVPVFLGSGLAAGAVVALGLTLVASVRRRRRDLALLKALGFTARQLGEVVAWQSTVAVAAGTIIGAPLGIVVGRLLWDAFAHEISAVPAPDVPAVTIALICAGALVLANVVATLPGRSAARTSTGLLLRAE